MSKYILILGHYDPDHECHQSKNPSGGNIVRMHTNKLFLFKVLIQVPLQEGDL